MEVSVDHGRADALSGRAEWLPDWYWGLDLQRRRVVAIGVLVLVVALLGWLGLNLAGSGGGGETSTTELEAREFVTALPEDRVETWDRLAQCESTSDWSADTGNGFYGGLQFTLSSWRSVGGTGNPADASRDEQIMRAQKLKADQGWIAWPACAGRLGLT